MKLITGAFFKPMSVKLFIAGLGLTVIIALIIYLLMIVVFSYQERKQAVSVHLPAIDSHGVQAFSKPEFKSQKEFLVELVDLNEEITQDTNIKDDESFLAALTLESRKVILDSNKIIKMPEVESVILEEPNISLEQLQYSEASILTSQIEDIVIPKQIILDNEERNI